MKYSLRFTTILLEKSKLSSIYEIQLQNLYMQRTRQKTMQNTLHFTEENIEELFNKAIEQGQIVAHYQPKYDAATGMLNGAEALARWQNPDGSLIQPAEFIPLLEKKGLITTLDWHILEQVCELLKRQIIQNVRTFPISVNFSRLHSLEKDFAQRLSDTVDKYGIPRQLLEVEITESSLINCPQNIIDSINAIRSKGFSVAIDDYGSGMASSNFVKDVTADVLKIDRTLMSHNCEDERERILLECIINFAHRLKFSVVAEGVETLEQLSFLRTCGCDTIQGYFFSKPIERSEYMELCRFSVCDTVNDDILVTQSASTATELLLNAVFTCFPLIIMSNLTRNSYYTIAYENFTTTGCPSTGEYTNLVARGAASMHPDDRELFARTFDRMDQLDAFAKGQRTRRVITSQLGDDGIYRRVETTNYYMQNPAVDDVLAITLSRLL